jgi:peroxiredoxin
MKSALAVLCFVLFAAVNATPQANPKPDSPKLGEPTDPQALKSYQAAFDWIKVGAGSQAITAFLKSNKQEGHCPECLRQAYSLARSMGRYQQAEEIAREWLAVATEDSERAAAHYRIGLALQQQALKSIKQEGLVESAAEFRTALQLEPTFTEIYFALGVSLARLHQDDVAREQFAIFLERDTVKPELHERAQRFHDRVDLARARMAPPFSITTLDGQHISLDSLAGKVVLIDFWATWCAPCLQALPHIRDIVHRFQNQPFVVLSISLDKDEREWKSCVQKNHMTWPQYRDGSTQGPIARSFDVQGLPATFTIDADGVIADQHLGDANIEGKIKKMIASALAETDRGPTSVVNKNGGQSQ